MALRNDSAAIVRFEVGGVSIHIELLSAEAIQRLDLSGLAIHSRYSGISALAKGDHENIFRSANASAIKAGGICAAAYSGGQLQVLGAVTPLEWDSQHFGIPMASLSIAAMPCCDGEALQAVLEKMLAVTHGTLDIRHVSAEVDIDEYGCLNAMLALGFEVLDIKRDYRWQDLSGVPVPKFRSLIREYGPEDHERVLELADKAEIGSRFSRDRFLLKDRVDALYHLWFEKLLGSSDHDVIALVFERAGKVEACGVIGSVDLSYAGVPVQFMDKGLYVSSAKGVGGYFPVLYELASRSLQRHALVQTCVSLNNQAAVRVLEKMQAGSESIRYALRLYRQ